MTTSRELFEFAENDTRGLVGWLDDAWTASRGDWVNLEPVVDDEAVEELAVRRGVAGWMSARGSDLPYVTLLVPSKGKRPTAASLGIQHGSGPKAARVLTAAGIAPPPAWVLRQDHPRRGLVYEAQDEIDLTDTLAFVFAAVHHLCPADLDGRWSAVTHSAR